MAYTPKTLYASAYPSNSGATLYTVPPSTSAIVKNIVMTNTTGDDATVHISIVPQSGTVDASNRILSDYNVPANGVNTFDCSIVMPTGASLHGTNTTSQAVVVTISGVEITS